MATVDIVRRIRRINNVLKTHHCTITQLHEYLQDEFDYDRKTIERDVLALLAEDFISVEEDSRPAVYFCNEEQRKNYIIRFHDEQLQILLLALESFKKETPKTIQQRIIDIENILSESLPGSLQSALMRYRDLCFSSYTIAGASNACNDQELVTILQAVRERRKFSATYHERKRTLSPILIKVVAGEFYLYAKDHGDDFIKWFRLSRFTDASLMTELAEINDDAADLTRVQSHHFGGFEGSEIVEYRITGNQRLADYFYERRIADDQEVEELDDDHFLVTFTQNDSYELIRFLASFGGNITAIEPAFVKDQVKEVWEEGLNSLE